LLVLGLGGRAARRVARPVARINESLKGVTEMRFSLLTAAMLGSLTAAAAVSADPGFFGTSGLMLAPTAEARVRGDAALGANYVSARHRGGARAGSSGTVAQYVAVSLLDNVETAFSLMNLDGKLGIQRMRVSATQSQDGWNVDRSFHVQALVRQGVLGTPSVAIGARDLFGEAVQNRSVYGGGHSAARDRARVGRLRIAESRGGVPGSRRHHGTLWTRDDRARRRSH
jgi:hypothetical protein